MSKILYLRQNYHFGPGRIADYLKVLSPGLPGGYSRSDNAHQRDLYNGLPNRCLLQARVGMSTEAA